MDYVRFSAIDYHLNDADINPYDPVVGGALQAATPMGRGIFTNNDCEHERETITGSPNALSYHLDDSKRDLVGPFIFCIGYIFLTFTTDSQSTGLFESYARWLPNNLGTLMTGSTHLLSLQS